MTREPQTPEEIGGALIALFERETSRRPGEYTVMEFKRWADRNTDRLQDLVLAWRVGIAFTEALESAESGFVGSWTVGADGKPERVYQLKQEPPQNPG
jgi:hypothetical protein